MRFHDICGNEHAKRAAEVALAGDHSIVFIGPMDSVAGELARLVDSLHIQMAPGGHAKIATAWQHCPCGHLKENVKRCTCSDHTIAQHYFDYPFPSLAAIYIEVVRPTPETILRWAQHFSDGELHVSVMTRILACRERGMEGPFLFMDVAWSLLRTAANQLELQPSHIRSIVEVAKTIARLAKADQVEAAHMAEAIQYRPRH
jgi:magnesium chelatase family protein